MCRSHTQRTTQSNTYHHDLWSFKWSQQLPCMPLLEIPRSKNKRNWKRCFITSMIQGTIWSTTNRFLRDSMLEPSTVAPDRDSFLLLLQRGDVQINIADVNSIVRDWGIHPCVVTAQQLHRNFRHAVSVKSHFYTIISLFFFGFMHIFSLFWHADFDDPP